MEIVENLFNLIKDKKINSLEKDRRAWKLTKDGRFSMKSSFDFLVRKRERQAFSLKHYFGINGFLPKWVSLLGKLGGKEY